jgi:hypothetical protein
MKAVLLPAERFLGLAFAVDQDAATGAVFLSFLSWGWGPRTPLSSDACPEALK